MLSKSTARFLARRTIDCWRNAKHRIGFQNCTGLGKGVKGSYADVVNERTGVHVANGTEVQPAVGLKAMHQTIGLDSLIKLTLDRHKNFRINRLERDRRLIPDARGRIGIDWPRQDLRSVDDGSFDQMRDHSLFARQRMARRGGNLTKQQISMLKGQQMPVGRDVHPQAILIPFNKTRTTHRQQFRVNRFCEKMKVHLGDFGSC